LASLCQGGWLSWEQALKHLAHVDIAIVCTQAPHYVIDVGDLATVLPQRGSRPLLIIDLAVPRNVDPSLKSHAGVRLYDIDDLQSIAHKGLARRHQELKRCDALIQEQVGHFRRWSREAVTDRATTSVSCVAEHDPALI
jgi:glutamyl-tRNA reductase